MKKKIISIVLPCLNESKTLKNVINQAKTGLRRLSDNYLGEIIVVDNNSTDKCNQIARLARVKVIFEETPGYGRALSVGIQKSKGDFILMGDCDGTYVFDNLSMFVTLLEKGYDLILGSRFKGRIYPGAMPALNRYLGNPLLTSMINFFYNCRLSDSQTGFRAFSRQAYRKIQPRSTGMEFASEMIIKAVWHHITITEVPIVYRRRGGESKLSPLADAWRHIRSILIYSPTYVFVVPGLLISGFGIVSSISLLLWPISLGKFTLGLHTFISCVLSIILGIHVLLTGFFTRIYTVKILQIEGGLLTRILTRYLSLEKLLLSGIILILASSVMMTSITVAWVSSGFSALAKERELVFASGLFIIGAQLISSSFLFELLQSKN